MIENRPILNIITHIVMILGVLLVMLPIYIAFVASTHPFDNIIRSPIPMLPGDRFLENYAQVLGYGTAAAPPVARMMFNSLVMAVGIATGKIAISILSAFAIVYFKFPFRMLCFWTIFITLMLPVEVRIVPTFQVAANLGLLNSYVGLTVPEELTEAARVDGAGPIKFFKDILLPLSLTNMAALFVILFIYGWNQYLWPLLITTDESMVTIVMGIKRMIETAEAQPRWHLLMATSILALVPPVVVVVTMQRLFVKGLIEPEK